MCLGVPGEVLSMSENPNGLQIGKVSFEGIKRDVVLTCVPEVQVGDWVLVHVGFAISRIDREEAERTTSLLRELGLAGSGLRVVDELEVEGAG
ncbi:MAG: HypC/HybG/HupF family hydrogenase formation chaperone [Acidimicrobiales bacterium]|nr:HypC/HybG/HupF family hydrogenase formation chaperone [Actinomycetota bacterium]MDA8185377.1 HypC/HybG/HupF family hydrogenase formation chaperone [Actinomycetota bacterium]